MDIEAYAGRYRSHAAYKTKKRISKQVHPVVDFREMLNQRIESRDHWEWTDFIVKPFKKEAEYRKFLKQYWVVYETAPKEIDSFFGV